ncbi:hypothetical protein ALI144C_19315 [Actinosynnema sp. ALI-1.44]|uniref:hypothetical protein n=1 Tax=Actinosynnema sp. ALI-1.44 TaxID=1933779 RepID=UPI00097C0EB1|nr:hypothetical protein [Actinosynnema sp. ALI-1.44]ONI81478.1 hypothetical protein ALI144C_19315 [Actinosynnema sp. ALI-1.44]
MSMESGTGGSPVGVVVWAGSNLTDFQISKLRHVYESKRLSGFDDDTERLAREMFDRVRLDDADHENEIMKNAFGVSGVQQAMDQEMIHAEVTSTVQMILLSRFEDVVVFRPDDGLFLRRAKADVEEAWMPFNDLAQVRDGLRDSGAANRPVVLVTIGHGGPQGHTHFPAKGMLTQQQISSGLAVPTDANTLYIPLQCYPQKAVEQWRQLGGKSVSINNTGRSDDSEMKQWIHDRLETDIAKWSSNKL